MRLVHKALLVVSVIAYTISAAHALTREEMHRQMNGEDMQSIQRSKKHHEKYTLPQSCYTDAECTYSQVCRKVESTDVLGTCLNKPTY